MERVKQQDLCNAGIDFIEATHTYLGGDGKEYKGITSTIIPLAYPHTYDVPPGFTKEQWDETLLNAAANGTRVHRDIQKYCEEGGFPSTPEGVRWMMAEEEYNIDWVANEYLVTDGVGLASQIDILAYVDGKLSVIDIKRTSKIHYDTTSLQTSIYKMWFERMNPGVKIDGCYIFWARDEKYKFEKLETVSPERISELCEAWYTQNPYYVFDPIPEWCSSDVLIHLSLLTKKKNEICREIDEVVEAITRAMEEHQCQALSLGELNIRYTAPSKSSSFDKKSFSAKYPDLVKEFTKETEKKGYITVTHKNK